MNWIYKNHELKTSGCYNMNFLFNNGKFYIMDNHLAAAWCWLQKIVYLANLHTSFLCNLIYPTFSRILLYSC